VRGLRLAGAAAVVALALGAVWPVPARAFDLASDNYDITASTEAVAKAKQKELEWSAGVFEDLFGVKPPRGRVTFSGGPPGAGGGMGFGGAGGGGAGAAWTLPWFTGALPGVPAGMGAQMNALTHEAAHLQLVHLVNDGCADSLKSSFNGYGSYLPDWVDETVAVHHEPDDMKKQRRGQLKAALGKHIPFAKYFAMLHPIGGKGLGGLPPGLVPPGGGGGGGGGLPGGGALPGGTAGMEEANLYYVQSLSVIEYLCDRAGKPFFRFAVKRLQAGKTMDDILREWHEKKDDIAKLVKDAKKGASAPKKDPPKAGATASAADELAAILKLAKGEVAGPLPKTVALLEQDWLKWVKAKYPAYAPPLPPYPE
jgi:hypothetical protein